MVKNIDRTEISTTEIKKLFQELEKCRNQDNNPDSQAYKRKIQVKLSLGSSTYIYINQNSGRYCNWCRNQISGEKISYQLPTFFIIKGTLKPNLLSNTKYFKKIFKVIKIYITPRSGKTWQKFEFFEFFLKNKVSVSERKVLAPIPIPKLYLGFSSWFRNLLSVVHYFTIRHPVLLNPDWDLSSTASTLPLVLG